MNEVLKVAGLQLVLDRALAACPPLEEMLRYIVRPNGTRLVSFSVFCMDFFASVHKESGRVEHFNRYMNTHMLKHQDNFAMPAAQS